MLFTALRSVTARERQAEVPVVRQDREPDAPVRARARHKDDAGRRPCGRRMTPEPQRGPGWTRKSSTRTTSGAAVARQFERLANETGTVADSPATIVPMDRCRSAPRAVRQRRLRLDRKFGLQNQDGRFIQPGVDHLAGAARRTSSADYEYEKYGSLQKSRQASPGTQESIRRAIGRPTGATAHTLTAACPEADQGEDRRGLGHPEQQRHRQLHVRACANQTIFTTTPLKQLPAFGQNRTTSMLNVM